MKELGFVHNRGASPFRGLGRPHLSDKLGQADISGRLATARSFLGRTQEGMAVRFGLTRKTYSRSEAGERPLEAPELLHLREDGINIEWLLTGEGEMTRAGHAQSTLSDSRGRRFGGGEGGGRELRDGQEETTAPRMTVEEIALVLRRTKALIENAVREGGWRPPRLTEEALLTMLFTLALRGADASIADIVEFLGFLRQDLERGRGSAT